MYFNAKSLAKRFGKELGKDKMILFITGMQECGTPFLARASSMSRVYLGNFEELDVDLDTKSDDRLRSLLQLAKQTINEATWESPPQKQKLIVTEATGREIRNETEVLLSHPSLAAGFKDSWLLLIYLDSSLKYLPRDFVIIAIFRQPIKVAESLKKGYHFSYDKSLNLSRIYNSNLISFLEKYDGLLLDFDWPEEMLLSETKLIGNKLGLVENVVQNFVDNSYPKTFDAVDGSSTQPRPEQQPRTDLLVTQKDIISISKLENRSQNNSKLRTKKYTPTQEEQCEIIQIRVNISR